ncbi:Alpha-ketoglutarate-dependent dioxygenase alkB 4 [Trichostrongylus colubriformis]|uniref:Alpha-ketoglutarate-dependent dioxygenase alkB 4 n=1 Tax=Trichostrongylus colubriformis TaxID=6319 RepID=A0AAN8IYF0_TRICO
MFSGFQMATAVQVQSQGCGCKGVRSCALCEMSERVQNLRKEDDKYVDYDVYVYKPDPGVCVRCPALTSTASVEEVRAATFSNSSDDPKEEIISIGGLLLVPDFITDSEEQELMEVIDGVEWVLSQSGRRKQDYGPKVNFKHKKVKTDTFVGMPEYADMLLGKMRDISEEKLGNYIPFEMCNLEYDESRKSAIEMHCDDTWIWGNRLISINLLNGSIMTLANENARQLCYVWMPRGSLLCMSDEARYKWKHAVLAHHIRGRRIALTMREPSLAFQEGGELYEKYGKQLIALSGIRVPLRKCRS